MTLRFMAQANKKIPLAVCKIFRGLRKIIASIYMYQTAIKNSLKESFNFKSSIVFYLQKQPEEYSSLVFPYLL